MNNLSRLDGIYSRKSRSTKQIIGLGFHWVTVLEIHLWNPFDTNCIFSQLAIVSCYIFQSKNVATDTVSVGSPLPDFLWKSLCCELVSHDVKILFVYLLEYPLNTDYIHRLLNFPRQLYYIQILILKKSFPQCNCQSEIERYFMNINGLLHFYKFLSINYIRNSILNLRF